MSDNIVDAATQRQVPISRRSAIRTGTLATLAAGLLGGTGTSTTVSAAPVPEVVVINTDDLSAESRDHLAMYREAQDELAALELQLYSHLTEDQRVLYRRISDAHTAVDLAEEGMHLAELARHLAPISGLIRMLGEHVMLARRDAIGTCCTLAGGFES